MEQRAWLKNVRNKCQNVSCIKSTYEERISSINNNISVNKSASDNAKVFWEGEWNRINSSKHETSGLTITDKTSRGFHFSIDAASGGHVGVTPIKYEVAPHDTHRCTTPIFKQFPIGLRYFTSPICMKSSIPKRLIKSGIPHAKEKSIHPLKR